MLAPNSCVTVVPVCQTTVSYTRRPNAVLNKFVFLQFEVNYWILLKKTDHTRNGVLSIFLVSLPIYCVEQEDDSLTLNGDVSTQLHNSFVFIMFKVKFSSILLKALDYG
jgi:hypothetical protein